MEFSVDFSTLLKMGGKLAKHKVQQFWSTTRETKVLTTNDGQIKGVKRKTVYDDYFYAFEGIPYAMPPIGDLRFRAPQPVKPWDGIRDCTNCKSKALQNHILLPLIEGSEDCLYLNVYVKKLESETPLPVVVWIHGGGFTIGEASRDIYAPDYLMMHNIVLVSIQYRLNALGFLSLNDPYVGVPGNAGLKDQIMALRWIQSNIHHFNGNENNITLMGESAGAASTHILMTLPQTRNLFHKAIMMSGSAYCNWCFVQQNDFAFRLANELGYKGANSDKQIFRFLQKVEGKKIIDASARLPSRQERRENFICLFAPTIEPYQSESAVITRPFLEMYRNAWSHEIPVILGGTSFEGLFSYQLPKKYPYVINELGDCEVMVPHDAKVGKNEAELKKIGLEIRKTFFNDKQPEFASHYYQFLEFQSYGLIWHGIYRTLLARLAYAKNTPTYLYRFDFDSPYFNHYRFLKCGSKQRGVCHADDLSYLFYNIAASKLPCDSFEFATIKRLTTMWVTFATTSNPNCEEISQVNWKPVESSDKEGCRCLNLKQNAEIINLPEYEKLQIFNDFYRSGSLF